MDSPLRIARDFDCTREERRLNTIDDDDEVFEMKQSNGNTFRPGHCERHTYTVGVEDQTEGRRTSVYDVNDR